MSNIQNIFSVSTNQGVAWLIKDGFFFKTSQGPDLTIVNECHARTALLPLTTYLLHFMRCRGYLQFKMYHVPRSKKDYMKDCIDGVFPEQKFILPTRPKNSIMIVDFVGSKGKKTILLNNVIKHEN